MDNPSIRRVHLPKNRCSKWQKIASCIKHLINEGANDFLIKRVAQRLTHGRSPREKVKIILKFIQSQRYMLDNHIARWNYENEVFQGAPFLIREIVKGRNPPMDCDCMCILGASLLRSLNFKTRNILMTQYKNNDYHHIFSEVLIQGRWVPLEWTKKGWIMGRAPNYIRRGIIE